MMSRARSKRAEQVGYLSLTEGDRLDLLVENAHGLAEFQQGHHRIGTRRKDEDQRCRR